MKNFDATGISKLADAYGTLVEAAVRLGKRIESARESYIRNGRDFDLSAALYLSKDAAKQIESAIVAMDILIESKPNKSARKADWKTFSLWMERDEADLVDAESSRRGISRSAVIREMVSRGLSHGAAKK